MFRITKTHKTNFLLCCFSFLWIAFAQAQIDTSFQKEVVLYPTFIETVAQNNMSYLAEKYNINIAQANIEKAKIIPDPTFVAGIFNNDQQKQKMGYGYNLELDWTLELGGKRRARVDLANSETELSKYALQDYFRNLQADATIQYLIAIQNEQLVKVQMYSYEMMNQLAKSDSIRAKLGIITAIDAKQSNLEGATMWNELMQSIGNWKIALSNLDLLMGHRQVAIMPAATGDFSSFHRNFHLHELIQNALLNRADLLHAFQNKDVSKKMMQLAKANRVIDLGIITGMTYNAAAHNELAPSPKFTSTNIGLSIPLKFSNHKKGELKEAFYIAKQTEAQYKQVELQIQNEVTQAYYNYEATQKQVKKFTSELLADAKLILTGKLYSYKRGDSSLLEVLNAQRTYNEVQQNYYETLFNNAVALVQLERTAGIWDIIF